MESDDDLMLAPSKGHSRQRMIRRNGNPEKMYGGQ